MRRCIAYCVLRYWHTQYAIQFVAILLLCAGCSKAAPLPTDTATLALTSTSSPFASSTQRRVFSSDGAPMARVPAGEFVMGSSILDEQPQHSVRLDAYWIDVYEVTNGRYQQCVAAGICRAPGQPSSTSHKSYFGNSKYAEYPVNQVDWADAARYCQWVAKRLPTEAEWEKAARGTNGRLFPWGNTWDPARVNSVLNGLYATTAVGSHPDGASPYGALDMAGNVWEWVADWYDEDYYASSPVENPPGPAYGESKTVRGRRLWRLRCRAAYLTSPSGNT